MSSDDEGMSYFSPDLLAHSGNESDNDEDVYEEGGGGACQMGESMDTYKLQCEDKWVASMDTDDGDKCNLSSLRKQLFDGKRIGARAYHSDDDDEMSDSDSEYYAAMKYAQARRKYIAGIKISEETPAIVPVSYLYAKARDYLEEDAKRVRAEENAALANAAAATAAATTTSATVNKK